MIRRFLSAVGHKLIGDEPRPTLSALDVLDLGAPLSTTEAQHFQARPRDAFDDALDEPIPYALTGKSARSFPGAGNVTEEELLAIARGAGILPATDAHDASNLVPTPDATIWCDPATGAMVRVPDAARTDADPARVTPPRAGSVTRRSSSQAGLASFRRIYVSPVSTEVVSDR